LLGSVDFLEEVEFEGAEFAVGDDEEVAAAAGGVEEAEGGEFFVELGEAFLAGGARLFAFGELGFEVVEEKGVYEFADVFFAGVVGTFCAAFGGFHHALEERTENAGGDARPVETAAGEEGGTVGCGGVGRGDELMKEAAVDIGEKTELVGEVRAALLGVRAENAKKFAEPFSEVGAVFLGFFDEAGEAVPGEDVGIFGEETKEESDEEAFEVVAREARFFEFVVEGAEEFDGFEVDFGLGLEGFAIVAADEAEGGEAVGEVGEGEVGEGLAWGTRWWGGGGVAEVAQIAQIAEIVEAEAGEVADEEPAGAGFGVDVWEVGEGLGGGGVEVLARAFHFHEEFARPEEVDAALGLAVAVHAVFVFGLDGLAVAPEDFEELIEEGFGVGFFALVALPFFCEGEGAGAHLFAGEGEDGAGCHGREITGGSGNLEVRSKKKVRI